MSPVPVGSSIFIAAPAEADASLPGLRVCRVLDQLVSHHGKPEALLVDNGPEFTGKTWPAPAVSSPLGVETKAPQDHTAHCKNPPRSNLPSSNGKPLYHLRKALLANGL